MMNFVLLAFLDTEKEFIHNNEISSAKEISRNNHECRDENISCFSMKTRKNSLV